MLAPWNMFEHSNKKILLTVRRRCFFCGSFLLLMFHICLIIPSCLLLQPCDHLLGKGWALGSLVCDVSLSFCYFPIWCLGSGVVLYCIDSWSVTSLLLHVLGSQNEFTWQEICMPAVSLYLHAQIQMRCTGGQDPHPDNHKAVGFHGTLLGWTQRKSQCYQASIQCLAIVRLLAKRY